MATPVPVVSMMYFFVFSPPKMTGAANPDFCATSVKCAIGLAGASRERASSEVPAANMLVFLGASYGNDSRGIHFLLLPDPSFSNLRRAAIFLWRRCEDLRCAIRRSCEDGCHFAGYGGLRARNVGAAEGRPGFRPHGFRESRAAGAEKPGGTQLPGVGLARAGRDRFGDRTIPVRGETESRFCAGAYEFLQRAVSKGRRCCRAAGSERSGAAGPGRFRDAPHF